MKNISTCTLIILLSLIFNKTLAQDVSITSRIVGQGEPVILIPGLTCDGSVWNETVDAIADNNECHIITLAGFANNKPIENLNNVMYLDMMSDNIIKYLKSKNLKKPAIIGHSLGGFLALKIAIIEPQLSSKLIIVDALPYLPAMRNPSISEESAKASAENYRKSMLEKSKLPIDKKRNAQKEFLKWMISDSTKIETATDWYLKSDDKTVAQAMYEMNTTDLREELSKIKIPTLVLGSWIAGKPYGATKEGALNSYKKQYEKLEGVIVDMSNTGKHFIMWDDPELLIKWIEEFI